MTYFTYNGRSSAEFGLHIEKKDVFSAPEYDAPLPPTVPLQPIRLGIKDPFFVLLSK